MSEKAPASSHPLAGVLDMAIEAAVGAAGDAVRSGLGRLTGSSPVPDSASGGVPRFNPAGLLIAVAAAALVAALLVSQQQRDSDSESE